MGNKVAAGTSVLAAAALLSVAGGQLIKESEGKRNVGYRDAVGIPTACYGHTGPGVRVGEWYSDDQCEVWFAQDIAKHQVPLVGKANCIDSAPLTGNQRDAVTSLIFNIGTKKFCTSTMAAKLRQRDYEGASAEFSRWTYAGGKRYNGLVIRRNKERVLFNSTAPWVPYTNSNAVIRQTVRYL